MYHPIPQQPDCASAWREAVRVVDKQSGHAAHDVIIGVTDPIVNTGRQNPQIDLVNDFLSEHAKPIETVANTIFPSSIYRRHGAPDFFDAFHTRVLPKTCRNKRWSGYYFERMTCSAQPEVEPVNPLWDIVTRIRDPKVKALNKYELSVFDPARDVDNSPYGGQCLSHLSFKVVQGQQQTLRLAAMYRNHFYIEKLLGNLIGLGRLLEFVARECDLKVGPLTIFSTHAEIDQPKTVKRADITAMLHGFDQMGTPPIAA